MALRFRIETPQLLLVLLLSPLLFNLRFRPARALVIGRVGSGRLYALPVVQILLPLLLIDLKLLRRLLLLRAGGRRLNGTSLLLHAQLQRVLLLLPLQLMLQ